jgi:hypothetical protein
MVFLRGSKEESLPEIGAVIRKFFYSFSKYPNFYS